MILAFVVSVKHGSNVHLVDDNVYDSCFLILAQVVQTTGFICICLDIHQNSLAKLGIIFKKALNFVLTVFG